MKNYALFIMAVFLALNAGKPANAEDSSYGQQMQKLQQMQHSRPNAENYLKSINADQDKPVTIRSGGGGHFFVPVSINGHEIEMLADTGATSIFICYKDAQAMGINMGNLTFNVGYSTANGRVMAARTTVKELQVGNVVMNDVPITISQNRNDDMSLLGMEFFKRLSRYEVRDGTLMLYK